MDASQSMTLSIPGSGASPKGFEEMVRQRMLAVGAELDGTERSDRELTLFCSGADAEGMLAALQPELGRFALPAGSTATLYLGPADSEVLAKIEVGIGGGAPSARKRSVDRLSKKRYVVGDWFAVPMWGRGWIVGRVNSVRGQSVICYYFGPMLKELPSLTEVTDLRPEDALVYVVSSDVGLREGGGYVILGGHETFNRAQWPNPEFECDDGCGHTSAVRHDPATHQLVTTRDIRPEEAGRLPSLGTVLGPADNDVRRALVARGEIPNEAFDW